MLLTKGSLKPSSLTCLRRWLRAPWRIVAKIRIIWVSRSAILPVNFLTLWPFPSRQCQRSLIPTPVNHYRHNTWQCTWSVTIPDLGKWHLWTTVHGSSPVHRWYQTSLLFRATLLTPNHGQNHRRFKVKILVVWAMSDSTLCNQKRCSGLYVSYSLKCGLYKRSTSSNPPVCEKSRLPILLVVQIRRASDLPNCQRKRD